MPWTHEDDMKRQNKSDKSVRSIMESWPALNPIDMYSCLRHCCASLRFRPFRVWPRSVHVRTSPALCQLVAFRSLTSVLLLLFSSCCMCRAWVSYLISRQHDLGVKAATSSPRYASCWYSTGKSRCGTGTKSCTDGKGLKISHVDRGEDGRSNLNCPVRSSAVQRQWYCSVLHRKKYFETLKHSMLWDNIAERALKVSITPPITLDQD